MEEARIKRRELRRKKREAKLLKLVRAEEEEVKKRQGEQEKKFVDGMIVAVEPLTDSERKKILTRLKKMKKENDPSLPPGLWDPKVSHKSVTIRVTYIYLPAIYFM